MKKKKTFGEGEDYLKTNYLPEDLSKGLSTGLSPPPLVAEIRTSTNEPENKRSNGDT